MKQSIIIAHSELVEPLQQSLGDQIICRSVDEMSTEQYSLLTLEGSVIAGVWCTSEQWFSLSKSILDVTLEHCALDMSRALCVELLSLDQTISHGERWPLFAALDPQFIINDTQQYNRLLETQRLVIENISLSSLQSAHRELMSQVKYAHHRREVNFLEMIAPMRALSKKFTQTQTDELSLCKRLLERLERERASIKEQGHELGLRVKREGSLQADQDTVESYSLTRLVKETLGALTAPLSWFHDSKVDCEATISLESTKRGLKLLLSQLSLLDNVPKINLRVDAAKGQALLDIITTGPGHSSPLLKARFQSDISYVREIAEHQGGQLKISSNLSGSLKISWSFINVSVLEVTEDTPLVQPVTKSLIWLIDDEASVRLTVKRWLTHLGYTIEVFEEGQTLLSELEETPRPPSLIVCDADMPTMTGLEVLSQVAKIRPGIKRLLYTAREPNRWVIEAFNQGVVHRFIDKSEGPEALKACLEEMLQDEKKSGAQLQALDELLAQELITLHLQPIFDSQGGKIEAVEALMRSEHPSFRGPLDILDATQVAEREFDLQRLLTSLSVKLRVELPDHIKLFMNIDPLVFGYPDRLDEVFAEIYPYASSVVLELTERGQLCGDAWVESVGYLRDKGFEIALDDLGAGYNSLGAVAAVSPEIIKLDISLVSNLHLSSPKREMVRLLAEYAHRHQIKTVAEGIEVAEEAEVCTHLGIKWLQGYHLARPMPLQRLKDEFKDHFEA